MRRVFSSACSESKDHHARGTLNLIRLGDWSKSGQKTGSENEEKRIYGGYCRSQTLTDVRLRAPKESLTLLNKVP